MSLISLIGPPASGKTTAAEWLAKALPARLLREDYAGNPFLAEFFLGRKEFALPSQLYFLFSRLAQLNARTWPDGLSVADYGFCQDRVYARHGLSDEDFELYGRLAAPAGKLVKPPDVLIHLDAGEDVLLERIARRGRGYEKVFTPEFLGSLRRHYRELTAQATCPVIEVDVGAENLLSRQGQDGLMGRVREVLNR